MVFEDWMKGLHKIRAGYPLWRIFSLIIDSPFNSWGVQNRTKLHGHWPVKQWEFLIG